MPTNELHDLSIAELANLIAARKLSPLELVEHGLLTDDDFRDFMFTNAVRFWGEVNPDFFKATVVEKQAAEVLAQAR